MSAPTLSVITITYRDPQGFARTAESLKPLARGDFGRSWEFVLVDQSPEENAVAVAELEREGWPLVHIKVPPLGIYGAHNLGLSRACGDYFWFLNGGDRLKDLAALARMVETLDGNPNLDLVCGGFDRTRDGAYLYAESPKPGFIANLVGTNRICHQAVLYRRRVFEKVGDFKTQYKLAADYEHLFRCYIAGLKVETVPDRLAEYDMDGSSNNHHAAYREMRAVHQSVRRQLPRSVALGNEVLWQYHYLRVRILKGFASSPLEPLLRPLWYAFKRFGAGQTPAVKAGGPHKV